MKNMKPIYWIIIIVIAALIAAAIILSRKEKEKDEPAQEAEPPEKAIELSEPAEEIPVRELESTAGEPSPLEIDGEISPPETRMTEEYKAFLEEQEAIKKDS